MRITPVAIVGAVLLALGAWAGPRSLGDPQHRLAAVAGADYVISIAVTRQPLGERTKVTLTYTLAKGDGAVAHEGRIEHVAVKDAEALRSLFAQTADEIANVIVTARVPLRAHTSDEPDSVR